MRWLAVPPGGHRKTACRHHGPRLRRGAALRAQLLAERQTAALPSGAFRGLLWPGLRAGGRGAGGVRPRTPGL